MPSGVGVMSKQIVLGTCHHYNWCQLGGAMQHAEQGKIINMDQALKDTTGIQDASLTIYPVSGYGNPDLIRQLIEKEKPDAIMHFTDPRFWGWLYNMEHEIRQHIPLIYYNIWDDLPIPYYNKDFYMSCDLLLGISKQTVNINKAVLGEGNYKEWQCQYVPHGINEADYYPINEEMPQYLELLKKKKQLFGDVDPEFVIMYNSRNIRRKMTSDIMIAYNMFTKQLPKEIAEKCYLILHTQPVDEAGTNLYEIAEKLTSDAKIILHDAKVTEFELNLMYNIADVTINVSSAEGWGLGNTESLMAGTMTITNTVGGLQDQSRFVDENDNWVELTSDFPSNSCGRYKNCGEWTLPIFPQLNLVGSVPTPYIYDSRADIKDIIDQLYVCYNFGRDERKRKGLKGREWVISDESKMSAKWMSQNIMSCIDILFNNFTPRKKFELLETIHQTISHPAGVYNPSEEKWY